jgi:hypothetical protein
MVAGLCGRTGGHYFDYALMLSHCPVIIQDAKPEIGDTQ